MATLTQQPMRITNIRQDARRSGMTPEDVALLRAFALSCNAEVIGGEVGDKSLSYIPTRRPHGLNEKLDVPEDEDGPGHANAAVVLNALMPILARTGVYSTLSCRGETYGHSVLSYDYFANVTLAALKRFGLYAYADLAVPGFGRGSRGEISLEIEPSALHGVNWAERGELRALKAMVVTAELPDQVRDRGAAHLARLAYYANLQVDAEGVSLRARGPGAFVTVWAEFESGFGGATAMGARGVRIESVAQTAFEEFLSWYKTGATLDPFLADQLLLPAILSEGETVLTVSKLTSRFLTVAWVIKQFLPVHITIKGHEGEQGSVRIKQIDAS